MKLRTEGFFREFGLGNNDGVPMESLFRSHAVQDEEKIVRYLTEGHLVAFSPGGPGEQTDPSIVHNVTGLYTDGVYVWPDALSFYVAEHHLQISDEFVRHMERSGWRIPSEDEIDLTSLEVW
ncbi:hypothetical protein [Symmachiella macrocystis]|nr:hypothetical protein [Symmachiella macrocystis]